MHNAEIKWIGVSPESARVRDVVQQLESSRCDYFQFLDTFAAAVRFAFKAKAVSLWAHDSVNARLIHVASDGVVQNQMEKYLIQVQDCLTGRCVERKRPITDCDPSKQYGSHVDQHPLQTAALGVTCMHSVPVLNLANPNQVLFVINLQYTETLNCTDSESEKELKELASIFGSQYEALLRSYCTRQENLLRIDLAKRAIGDSLKGLCNELADRVKASTQSEAVAVLLKNSSNVVEAKGFTLDSIRLLIDRFSALLEIGFQATQSNRECINLPTTLSGASQVSESILAVPIRDFRGYPVGAVICLKSSEAKTNAPVVFTPDNITICDWLGQAFAPFYELMSSEEHRLAALGRLGHELKGPVTGMNAAIAFTSRLAQPTHLFGRYLRDLKGYTESMGEILQSFELATDENLEMSLEKEPISWVVDLVAPATKAVEESSRGRGVKSLRIERSGLDRAPTMLLDKSRMLQVVFNLLENGVKYAKEGVKEIRIEVMYRRRPGRYEICFRDWGIGVPPGYEDRIFLMGVRAPNATIKQVAGRGFGLAISRRIVQAHGGDLVLRSREDGSDFIISLPQSRYLSERVPMR